MLHQHEKRTISIIVFHAALLVFASFIAQPVAAQQSTRSDPMAGAERERQRQLRRMEQMETGIRISSLEKESRNRPTEERARMAETQLRNDFEQLQSVNNQMMVMVFVDNTTDYKRISEAITEIRKRAARLKSNLPLPPADKESASPIKGADEINQEQVKPALKTLDNLIQSFVTNPVFQQPQVVDLEDSSKARRDLEAIIKLSENIRKGTDKLAKVSTP